MNINTDQFPEELGNLASTFNRIVNSDLSAKISQLFGRKLTRLSDFNKESKNVFPVCFTGAKIAMFTDLSDRFRTPSYRNFGNSLGMYQSFSHFNYSEMTKKPKLHGLTMSTETSIDPHGCVISAEGTYKDALDDWCEFRFTPKFSTSELVEIDLTIERKGDKNIGSVSWNLMPNNLELLTQWMYKLTPEISVGSEFCVEPLTSFAISRFSLSCRYENLAYTASSTFSTNGFQTCFFKQIDKDLQIAAILNQDLRRKMSTIGVGMSKLFPNGAQMKVFVDSQLCAGCTCQTADLFNTQDNNIRIVQLIGSALFDPQGQARFGLGLKFYLDL